MKPPVRLVARWGGEQRFDIARQGTPPFVIDGNNQAGPGPVISLVAALAACASIDVVEMLAKRRTPARALAVEVTATRADAVPARLTHVVLHYRLDGEGIERVHAERAIALAVDKYCSVRDSLDPNMPVEWRLTLNGAD